MLTLESAELHVSVDPAHGAEICDLRTPGGPNALARYDWRTPIPAAGGGYGDSQNDWLSRYRGGWQELFPNTGEACEVVGVPLPFHGEASQARWEVVTHSQHSCELRTTARLPLLLSRRMTLADDAPTLHLEERVVNDSGLEQEFLWGHHPVFPAIPGASIDLPTNCRAHAEPAFPSPFGSDPQPWPHLLDEAGDPHDLSRVPGEAIQRVLYVTDLGAGWAALRQPAPQPGVALAWDAETFPCMWFWLQNGTSEFPWFGRARMLALEPQAAYPCDGLAAASRRGRAHRLPPHSSWETWLTITLLPELEQPIADVRRDGRWTLRPTALR